MRYRLIGGPLDDQVVERIDPADMIRLPIPWDDLSLRLPSDPPPKEAKVELATYRKMRACVGSYCKTFFVFEKTTDDEALLTIDQRGYL